MQELLDKRRNETSTEELVDLQSKVVKRLKVEHSTGDEQVREEAASTLTLKTCVVNGVRCRNVLRSTSLTKLW